MWNIPGKLRRVLCKCSHHVAYIKYLWAFLPIFIKFVKILEVYGTKTSQYYTSKLLYFSILKYSRTSYLMTRLVHHVLANCTITRVHPGKSVIYLQSTHVICYTSSLYITKLSFGEHPTITINVIQPSELELIYLKDCGQQQGRQDWNWPNYHFVAHLILILEDGRSEVFTQSVYLCIWNEGNPISLGNVRMRPSSSCKEQTWPLTLTFDTLTV